MIKISRQKKRVRAILLYLLLTVGLWMFLLSYSNSVNRLTTDKISPASLTLTEDKAELKILERNFILDIGAFRPESKLYYLLYLLTPDELRLITEFSSY